MMFLPLMASKGNPLPKGPRMPTLSPASSSWRARVTLPTWRTEMWRRSFSGLGGSETANSPAPKTVHMMNWPDLIRNSRATSAFSKEK